jgi:hypothetical protein
MRIWRFGVMEQRPLPRGSLDLQSKAGVIEICVYWMQFVLAMPEVAYSTAALAIDYGLLEILPRTTQYMGIDPLVTALSNLKPKMGSSAQRVSFFVDEVFLPSMFLGRVYQATSRALQRLEVHTDAGTVSGLPRVDERIPALVLSWQQASQVAFKLASEQAPAGCCNSQASPHPIAVVTHCTYISQCPAQEDLPMRKCMGCSHVSFEARCCSSVPLISRFQAQYCSQECQRAGWRASGDNHREICKSIMTRSSSTYVLRRLPAMALEHA